MRYQYKNPQLLYRGKRVNFLSIETDHPQGGTIQREVVEHPGAVVILPLLNRETVVLIKNDRYVVQETLWELPAGTLEEKESIQTCAERELEEETGYRAGKMTFLFDYFSTPGFCNELLYTFVAEDLTYVGQNLDSTETITFESVPLQEAWKMIREGTIRDAKTICTLLYFKAFLF